MAKQSKKEKYISALIKELEYHRNEIKNVKTIYIGGGTPTSLELPLLEKLLITINNLIDMDNVLEFSTESNPNDYNLELILLLKKYNINRVSIGVQTFDKEQLKFLGRTHTKNDVLNAIKLLRENDFTNISIDMIFSLVNQTEDDLEKDLIEVLKLDADHISYYSLILEEKSKLYYLLGKNKISMNSEELEGLMYNKVINTLEENSLMQYEISNFSKPGFESLHNKTYWLNLEYLGVGTGSHSMYQGFRYYNPTNITKYIKMIEEDDFTFHTSYEYDSLNEEMMLGLRLIKGININEINEKYNIDILTYFPDLNKYLDQNIIEVNNGYLRFTRDGILLGNLVFQIFVEVL
jgi:oxygen-independent coproporphyrinogen-3 oxidase